MGISEGLRMITKTYGKVLLSLCLIVLFLPGLACGEGFDLIYDDPEGDVEDWEGIIYAQGYEHIDILEVRSSENILGNQLILEMIVSGVITDSDDVTYYFYLMDGEEWIYIIMYSNGVCAGFSMEDGNEDVLVASGSGTDTLEVRVQMSDIGEVKEFDFWGEADEYDDVAELSLFDYAPDSGSPWDEYPDYYEMPVMITEPKPGATVSGTKIIEGNTDPYYGMESVEIQFDSESEGGWILTSTNDDWETWSYEWQSTGVADGKHTLHARAYDGTDYYFDTITVYVDQSNAVSPRTTDVPALKVGYEYRYSVDMTGFYGLPTDDMDMNMEMNMTVTKKETIEINGTVYEAYVIDTTMSMRMTMTFMEETMSVSSTGDGTQWLRSSDLASIKGIMNTQNTYSSYGMTMTDSQQSTTIYEPPMDKYEFPVSIAETWTSASMVTSEITTSGSYSYSTEDTYESISELEALHVEEVTVPAGTFETFVIWSKEMSEEYYGGSDPFFGSVPGGYVLEYYSPDIGLPVKTEYYSDSRELTMSMELVSYGKSEIVPGTSPSGFGWELPLWVFLIPILAAVIIGSAMAVRRRRKAAAAVESWQTSAAGTSVPGQASSLGATPSLAYPGQTAYVTPTQSSPPYPQPGETPQHYPPPPPPPPGMVNINCPKCSKPFSVLKGTDMLSCPYCGVRGSMG